MGKSKPPVEIIDAEFTVVSPAHKPPREPFFQPGAIFGLLLLVLVLGGATLLRLYSLGDWPFDR